MISPVEGEPALLIEQDSGARILVIADIHIGFECELAERGVSLPSQTDRLISKLVNLLRRTRPEILLILGDLKHSVAGIMPLEREETVRFLEAAAAEGVRVWLTPGNHDGGLPALLEGLDFVELKPVRGFLVKDGERYVGLLHGHTWPAAELLERAEVLILGHTHPVVELCDSLGYRYSEQVWVKVPLDKDRLRTEHPEPPDEIRARCALVMPSFNTFLGGNPVNRVSTPRPLLGPLLESEAAAVEEAEVYLLDGTYLGTIGHLRAFASDAFI